MVDNISVTAGSSGTWTAAVDDIAGIGYQRVKVALGPPDTANDAIAGNGVSGVGVMRVTVASDSTGVLGATQSGEWDVGGFITSQAASSTITRPADTTPYSAGDLVANSVTAGSVAALQFTTMARSSGNSGLIVSGRIQKSTASVTNAAFRIHLFTIIPTFTSAGDNSLLTAVVQASAKGYLGYINIPAMVGFQDCAWGTGNPDTARGAIPFVAVAQIIYGFVEARGAYTPGTSEVFTVYLDAQQN